MRITEKIFGPQHETIDPAYWEPSFPLYFGGDGDGGGGGGDPDAGSGYGGGQSGPVGPSGPSGGNAGPSGVDGNENTTMGPGNLGSPFAAVPQDPETEPEPGRDMSLNPFLDALEQYNTQFLDANYSSLTPEQAAAVNARNAAISEQLGQITPAGLTQAQQRSASIAQALQGIGMGAADPRFEAYRQAQLEMLENQRQGELGRTSEMLSRRGLGGTSAEQNAAASVNQRYNLQGQSLSSQLGLQSLGRQDAALQNALGAYGQSANLGLAGGQFRSGILGQQAGLNQQNLANQLAQIQSANQARSANLEALTAGLQNLTAPYALETARTAAQNLGESGDDDGGNSLNPFGWMDTAFGEGSSDRYGWVDPLSGGVNQMVGGSGK